jgi:hypothetical protein
MVSAIQTLHSNNYHTGTVWNSAASSANWRRAGRTATGERRAASGVRLEALLSPLAALQQRLLQYDDAAAALPQMIADCQLPTGWRTCKVSQRSHRCSCDIERLQTTVVDVRVGDHCRAARHDHAAQARKDNEVADPRILRARSHGTRVSTACRTQHTAQPAHSTASTQHTGVGPSNVQHVAFVPLAQKTASSAQ